MGKYFGTDGFRGEANVDLTVEHAYKVGRYLGYYYGKQHEDGKAHVVIGKDTRLSSYMFEYSLVAGLTASGADVYLMHVTPTPSVSYIVRTGDFDCGIMISASHNPYYDNGIKVINGQGYKLEAAIENEIEQYIDGELGEIPFAKKDSIGKTTDYTMGRNRYIGYLLTIPTRPFKGMRIGLDCAMVRHIWLQSRCMTLSEQRHMSSTMSQMEQTSTQTVVQHTLKSFRHLSRRRDLMWDLHLMVMRTDVLQWTTRVRSWTETRSSMSVAVT